MYLIGNFERYDGYLFADTENPMSETKIVDAISSNDLIKAKNDDSYQVINLLTLEYYNPKKNQWKKIKRD